VATAILREEAAWVSDSDKTYGNQGDPETAERSSPPSDWRPGHNARIGFESTDDHPEQGGFPCAVFTAVEERLFES
jgi:hypothetical protein